MGTLRTQKRFTRHSLLLRLLAVSLGVAALAVVATALLATYGTGARLREELEGGDSLLETDSYIRGLLLAYARNNSGWDGAEPLVRDLAEETGRRIALTTPAGETIVDSAALLGGRAGELPSTPAAPIDATETPKPLELAGPSAAAQSTRWQVARNAGVAYYGWQMTDDERREREALVDDAEACMSRAGIEATIQAGDGADGSFGLFLATTNGPFTDAERLRESDEIQDCLPAELYAPSAAAREINDQAVELAVTCLDEHGLTYEISEDVYGMRVVHPRDGEKRSGQWQTCEEAAQADAVRPYVAPPADLYLGTTDRFDPFSPEGWRRTAGTTAAILAVAAVVTVAAGRRLVRPVVELTSAAQRMSAGDRTVRVPSRGNDEVGRLAEAFNVMAESIERSDLERRALVSDVAHELRTPLTNVRTHLEAVEVGLVPLDASFVRSLREESVLLERLVSDLHDLALADAGMLRMHPEERDAADLAAQAVAAQRPQAEESGVTVRVDSSEVVPVYVDPARLRQALGNLVSNAVTHTPPGGTVEVGVRRSAGEVALTVTDTGEGIAPEHLPHLFDRFYRADPSRSRSTGGSGLGLAITKHLVEAHGGRVEVASTPSEGSTFTVILPAGGIPPH